MNSRYEQRSNPRMTGLKLGEKYYKQKLNFGATLGAMLF